MIFAWHMADLVKGPRLYLVVGAVGARNKLSELLVGREPRLEVVFLDGSVVQFSGDDVHHPVRQAKVLVELLCRLALQF